MRYTALLLLLAAGSANAAILDVEVSHGNTMPEKFTYTLGSDRQTLDLRDSNRYTVAVKDKSRGKEICRDAEYRTGLVMTLRSVERLGEGRHKVEVVGQVSNLESLEEGDKLACGVNVIPKIKNEAFSDTSIIEAGKPKVMVIDGTTTLVLTIKE